MTRQGLPFPRRGRPGSGQECSALHAAGPFLTGPTVRGAWCSVVLQKQEGVTPGGLERKEGKWWVSWFLKPVLRAG